MVQNGTHAQTASRFHLQATSRAAACAHLRQPIIFEHLASARAMQQPTLPPSLDSGFSVVVHHRPISRGHLWISQRHRTISAANAGLCVFDMTSEPTAQILEPFEFSRFEFPRAALDDLASEQGLRYLGELRVRECGTPRPCS